MRSVSPHTLSAYVAARQSDLPGRRSPPADRSDVRTVTLSYRAEIPGPVSEAFDFVAEPATWPLFFETIEFAARGVGWGQVGGHGRMTTRFPASRWGRSVESQLEITEWLAPVSFRYVARQSGRPDLDNRRVFEMTPAGTVLRGTTTLVLRGGRHWLADRLAARALQRIYDRAMSRLTVLAGAAGSPERVG